LLIQSMAKLPHKQRIASDTERGGASEFGDIAVDLMLACGAAISHAAF
jgi:hypothetical protein